VEYTWAALEWQGLATRMLEALRLGAPTPSLLSASLEGLEEVNGKGGDCYDILIAGLQGMAGGSLGGAIVLPGPPAV
jgi:hypothetical protein